MLHIIGLKCKLIHGEARYSLLSLTEKGNFKNLLLKPNSNISLKLVRKTCIGYWDVRKRRYERCDKPINQGTQCTSCKLKDLRNICFSCSGIKCSLPKDLAPTFSTRKFIIYLAQFGKIKKVGVCRKERFLERLLEQGADSGMILGVKHCLEARRLEKELSRKYKEVVSSVEKIDNLFLGEIAFPINLRKFYSTNLRKISGRRLIPLSPLPQKISGRLLLVKGPLLFLKKMDKIYWLNLRELFGWKIFFNIEK